MKDTINDIIPAILITALLGTLIVILIYMGANLTDTFHIRTERAQVIEANNGEYAVVDGKGEVWEFTSDRIYFEGETLTIKFDTLGTETIYDDIIITVKKQLKRG